MIILGGDAQLELPDDAHGTCERWVTDEPSRRGIEAIERMRLVRDDIDTRVRRLVAEVLENGPPHLTPSTTPRELARGR